MRVGFGLISLIIAVVCAWVCYRTAVSKGRNPLGWTLLGFFFPIIGVIVVLLISDRRGLASSR